MDSERWLWSLPDRKRFHQQQIHTRSAESPWNLRVCGFVAAVALFLLVIFLLERASDCRNRGRDYWDWLLGGITAGVACLLVCFYTPSAAEWEVQRLTLVQAARTSEDARVEDEWKLAEARAEEEHAMWSARKDRLRAIGMDDMAIHQHFATEAEADKRRADEQLRASQALKVQREIADNAILTLAMAANRA